MPSAAPSDDCSRAEASKVTIRVAKSRWTSLSPCRAICPERLNYQVICFFWPRIYPESFFSKLRHSLWDPGLRSYQQRRNLLCNTTWGIILCKERPRFQAWHLFIAAPRCRDRSSEFKQAFSLTLRRLLIHFPASFDSYSTLSTSRLVWVSGCIIQTQSNPAPRPSGIADI